METKKTTRSGQTLGKPVLLATTLLLTAISLSACMVAPDRGGRGDWGGGRHHHWDNDRDWNNDRDWRDDDDNDWWKRRR